MLITIEPISSFDHVDDLALVIQVICLFTGEVLEGDISWDDDLIIDSFIEAKALEGEDREALDNYVSERNKTIELAREQMLSDVRTILRERHAAMSEHFPFIVSNEAGKVLTLKELTNIDGSGAAYLWQSLFDLMNSDNDYLQISEQDAKAFHVQFRTVFEVIACYALAGRGEQIVWYTGRNRSTTQFLRFLRRIVSVIGSGHVKTYDQLDHNQRSVNEAGVDAICLSITDGVVYADAELLLVQSTVQKSGRRTKVMGENEVKRFKNFFVNNPSAAVQGVLAIPFDSEPIDAANCKDLDCIYMPREAILRYIGREPVPSRKRQGTRLLDALMYNHSELIRGKLQLMTVDGNISIA